MATRPEHADPEGKTEGGGRKPPRHSTSGLVLKHEIVPRRFVSQPLANARNRKLHFTLNHYRAVSCVASRLG